VDLRQQQLSDKGGLLFAAVLPACPALLVLRLAHNSLGDSAATAFVAAFGSSTALQVLDLSHNCISDSGMAAFARGLIAQTSGELRELYLQGNVGTAAAAALELTHVPRLRVLGFAPPAEDRPALDMACRLRGVRLLDRGPEERQRLAVWMTAMTDLQYSHPRKYGKGSRKCRVCNAHQGLIRKYHLMMCRRCFRERAVDIGFEKLR
jgi:small subunit ribosomal protein S29e